jgi:hypothetical protein
MGGDLIPTELPAWPRFLLLVREKLIKGLEKKKHTVLPSLLSCLSGTDVTVLSS